MAAKRFPRKEFLQQIDRMIEYARARAVHDALREQIETLPPSVKPSLLEILAVNSEDLDLRVGSEEVSIQKSFRPEAYRSATRRLSSTTQTAIEAITSYHNQRDKVLSAANIDGLTGLLRHEAMFETFVDIYVREAFRVIKTGNDVWLGLVHLDLDNFRDGNTSYGHPEMNKVLSNTGSIIRSMLKHNLEAAVRSGGDEFVAFSVSSQSDGPKIVAEKLVTEIGQFEYELRRQDEPEVYRQTASSGFVSLELNLTTARAVKLTYDTFAVRINGAQKHEVGELIAKRDSEIAKLIRPIFDKLYESADAATYEAKVMGGNRSEKFDPKKIQIDYYNFIRELYAQVQDSSLTHGRVTFLVRNYLNTHRA